MSAPATGREFRTVGYARALPDNYVNPYHLEDLRKHVSVVRIGGKLYAFDDPCKHEGRRLSADLLTGTTLMCQCHRSQYNVTSRAELRGPSTEGLTICEVREQGGKIEIRA